MVAMLIRLALGLALFVPAVSHAEPVIHDVRFSADATAPPQGTADEIALSWPFCPSDAPCTADRMPVWVEMRISLAAYSARLTDQHDDIKRIVSQSLDDVAPIATALQSHLYAMGDRTLRTRAAWAQGLAQSIQYAFDTTTGFTDYPKFALEFLVDQNGDCDDAAIFSGALLEQLGLETYFVLWAPLKGDSGHLSTAVERNGDLERVEPPAGSQFVKRPSGKPLLQVDGVGSEDGCKRGCGALGLNDWEENGLRVETVVGVRDPNLAVSLPLHVWQQGGTAPLRRTLSDRRKLSPNEVVFAPTAPETLEAQEKSRLLMMGLEPTAVETVVGRRWRARVGGGDATYWGLTAVVAAGLLVVGMGAVHAARRRQRASERRTAERKRRSF